MFLGAEITYDGDVIYKLHILFRCCFGNRLCRDKRLNISTTPPLPKDVYEELTRIAGTRQIDDVRFYSRNNPRTRRDTVVSRHRSISVYPDNTDPETSLRDGGLEYYTLILPPFRDLGNPPNISAPLALHIRCRRL